MSDIYYTGKLLRKLWDLKSFLIDQSDKDIISEMIKSNMPKDEKYVFSQEILMKITLTQIGRHCQALHKCLETANDYFIASYNFCIDLGYDIDDLLPRGSKMWVLLYDLQLNKWDRVFDELGTKYKTERAALYQEFSKDILSESAETFDLLFIKTLIGKYAEFKDEYDSLLIDSFYNG